LGWDENILTKNSFLVNCYSKENMKKHKKVYIAKVIINAKNIPDFGMGKGVLAEQEISFTDGMGRGFNSPLFIMARMEHEDRLVKELCRVEWKEMRTKRKLKK